MTPPPIRALRTLPIRSRSYIQIARFALHYNNGEGIMRKVSNLIVLLAVVIAAIIWLRMQG